MSYQALSGSKFLNTDRKNILKTLFLKNLQMMKNIQIFPVCKEFNLIGPRRDKACLWGFRQSETQTSLLSYRDQLEN